MKKEDYLAHYGVLGMKWGVRRYQPYSVVPRKSGKIGTEKGTAKKKTRTRIGYDEDIRIPKGTKAYRVAVKDDKLQDRTYVTIDKNDRDMYKGTWPTTMRNNIGTASKDSKIYEHRFKTTEDLISPSAKTRQEIGSKLISNKEVRDEIIRTNMARQVRKDHPEMTPAVARMMTDMGLAGQFTNKHNVKSFRDGYKKEAAEFDKEMSRRSELGRATMFFSAMGDSDRIKTIYGKEVVKRGFNSSIDDHGADFPGKNMVNAPVIVYDPDRRLRKTGQQFISKRVERKALNTYVAAVSSMPGSMAKKNYVPNVVKKAYNEDNYYKNKTWNYIYPNSEDMYKKKSRR